MAFVPVLVAWFDTCWRFWAAMAPWCVGLGRGVLRSPAQAAPWFLAAAFAVLACRRRSPR